MAVNQKGRCRPFKNCPKAILNVFPKECQKLKFSDLVIGKDYNKKGIIGKINHLYPIAQRGDGIWSRKIFITDALSDTEEEAKKLTVFLMKQFAKDSSPAEVEGFIIITNFIVEKLPRHPTSNEMLVLVMVRNEDSHVWFGRKMGSKEKKILKTSNPWKKQKISADNDIEEDGDIEGDDESHVVTSNLYEYTKLGNLTETSDKMSFHVYGIVDKCDLRVAQKKKTQMLDLTLTDQTETGFSCVVFAPAGETFPNVYPGDIVRIHRMQVSKFRGKLRGRCPNPKYILVFSKNNEGDKPRTVAKTFTFTPKDVARFKELFEWNMLKNQPKFICDIKRDDFANLIVQVIGVYIARHSDTVILKIWDGTKTDAFPGVHWGLHEERLDQRLFSVAKNYYVILFVYGHHTAKASELEPGQYIEVQDAHLYSPRDNPDDLKLCLHAGNKVGRGITVLDDTDNRIIYLKERLEKIISDALEFGNQTDDLLSQNNSIFLNCDISVRSTPQQNEEHSNVEECVYLEELATTNGENIEILNEPLPRENASLQNSVVSVTQASIKPGQSTQEFGLGMPRYETVLEDENKLSRSEPDPACNMTPLQTRYFFHNPLQLSSQLSTSIFPTLSNATKDEWWNSIPTVTVTDGHSNIKPTSLAEVVQHSIPYKFRLLVAVLCFQPETTSIEKFIHLYCPKCFYITENITPSFEPFERRDGLSYYFCPKCSKKEVEKEDYPVLEYTFIMSFSLHDGTGPTYIEAFIWKENAVKFFNGITPEEALRHSASADSILHKLWNICPNCRPFNSSRAESISIYPILDCCILSYTSVNNTQYQMFDTILI